MNDSTKILPTATSGYVLKYINQNRRINIYNGLTFGRTEGNELLANDPLVSKIHCKIHLQGTEIFVEDVGSSNKTKVNGKTIAPNVRTPLRIGDNLEIGNQQFILQKIGQQATPTTPTLHAQPSESLGNGFKSFFDLKELRYSTRIISALGPGMVYALYNQLNESQCRWGVTPYPVGNFMNEGALKCVLICMFFGFINHLIGRQFKAWSWQSVMLVMGGATLAIGITAITYGERILNEAMANEFACNCMASDPSQVLKACSKWMQGENLALNTVPLRPFQRLPKETQSAIQKNLTPYLNQSSQTPSAPSLSQLPLSPVPTQETTVQPAGQTGAGQSGSISPPSSQAPQLSPEQIVFIKNQRQLAFDLYRNKEYAKAIIEVRKIFTLVNDYLNAREIERYALEAQQRMEQLTPKDKIK